MHKLLRNLELRQKHIACQPVVLNLTQHLTEVQQCFRPIREALAHLGLRRQVKFAVREPVSKPASAPNRSGLFLGLLDAEQDVVGLRLRFVQVKCVVRSNRLDPVRRAKSAQHLVDGVFFGQPVAVDFGIKILAKLSLPP